MAADPVLRTLSERFGHPGFRPGQEALVRAVLSGRDALGILPTGGGKSLTYLLPAHHLDGVVIVVSPLIALMQDQHMRARACGLRSEALAGPMSTTEVERVLCGVESGSVDLLLVAPERLQGRLGERLGAARIALLVVDEAHCLIGWGYDFRPAYRVLEGLGLRWGVPVLALTATATPPMREALSQALGLSDPVRVELSFRRPNLSFAVRRVATEQERWQALWGRIAATREPALIYATTRAQTERLSTALRGRGRKVSPFHAGMTPERRGEIQAQYLTGNLDLVVATCAFGMGVDKPDIREVIHWSPPDSLEAYYQEAGRGGRDGSDARALLLWRPPDLAPLRERIDHSFPPLWHLGRELWSRRDRQAPSISSASSPPTPGLRSTSAGEGETAMDRAILRFSMAGSGYGGWHQAWHARQAARTRLRAVRRYLTALNPEQSLLAYLGEPGAGNGLPSTA